MIYLILAVLYVLMLDRSSLKLLRLPLVQHLFGAAICCLMVLWQLKTELQATPPIHFLGITTLVIVLGLRLSVLAIPFALLLPIPLLASLKGQAIAIELVDFIQWFGLIFAAIQSYLGLLACHRWLPRHLFVVIFVSGFFNSMLCALSYMGVLWLGFSLFDVRTPLNSDYLMIMPLLALPEGLLNGMVLTLLLVYRPDWLKYSLWQDTKF